MATISDIKEEFSQFGVDVDINVLKKFQKLCERYSRNPESIVEIWMSYSIRKLDGESPCDDNIEGFEKDELSRLRTKNNPLPKNEKLKVYHGPSADNSFSGGIIDVYGDASPLDKRDSLLKVHNLTPSVYSSEVVTPSRKYNERSNAGDVVLKYGSVPVEEHNKPCNVSVKSETTEPVKTKYRHMFERLRDRVDVNNELSLQLDFENSDVFNDNENSEGKSLWLGRIVLEAQEKLNRNAIMLENPMDGKCSLLDLRGLDSYSFFPGQTIVALAEGLPGQTLRPNKVSLGVMPRKFNSVHFEGIMNVVVSAGPYTLSSNMLYEPLSDLLTTVKESQPEVCILLGPFLDCRHKAIASCQLAETFESLFEKQLDAIVEIAQQVKTEFLIVPSVFDVHHEMVYPTPPFSNPKHQIKNVTMVSDPAMISVSGVHFAVTSVDVLLHLKRNELVLNPKEDVFTRLSRHLLLQHQFYPLRPPCDNLPINHQKYISAGVIDNQPHVMILPSTLRHFVTDIDGCVVVNPERLAKAVSGGTYARMKLVTGESGILDIFTEIVKI